MSSIELQSEQQVTIIESNKQFARLEEKPLVMFTQQGKFEVTRNRLTHSYEVATSARVIALTIEKNKQWPSGTVDYQGSIRPASLLHDIGHCSFAHPGAELLDQYFKEKGLDEGFSDNNNNLVVMEHNSIVVSDHTACSVIKYPEKLYSDQKERYIGKLEKALQDDVAHFSKHGVKLKKQTCTIACQIMDEADRNAYICSDIADYLCLGHKLSAEKLQKMATDMDLACRYTELPSFISLLNSDSKTAIKAHFLSLKNKFNTNYKLTKNGIEVIDKDLHAYREFLWKVEFMFYITPIRKGHAHKLNMARLKAYADKVTEKGYCPSKEYGRIIECAKDEGRHLDVLRAQRDMIAEATDQFVVVQTKELDPGI